MKETPGRTQDITVVALGELADVLPGLSTGMRLEHDAAGSHQVVLSRHLTPGLPYRYSPADEFRINPKRDARKYSLLAGDILFMSRGTRNVASWIEAVSDPSVAPVSFYILRPRRAVDPSYLTWFLNQPGAQRAIADIRTGAGTPIVQRLPFMQLPVALPDMEEQATLGRMGAAMTRERQTLEQLAAATAKLHDLNSEQIARGLLARSETDNAH